MRKKIVVGFDGSEPSAQAVMWAAHEAATTGVTLRIVSCYSIPYGGDGFGGWATIEICATLLEDCQHSLAQMRRLATAAYPALDIATDACAGSVTAALTEDVDPGDLIVVGPSSHHDAGAFWLGSTPRYLVRHSPCPVVVVRDFTTGAAPTRVVVAADGSAMCNHAVRWAGVEAELHNVDLLIVHAWEYPYLAADSTSQGRDITNIDAGCLLDKIVEVARDQFAVAVTGELVEASPANAILATVRKDDLLVLGSSGRGAIAAHLLGSTVNTVLDRCPATVVVVRGQD